MIKSLSILGLRGFETKQTLEFAIPNGEPGSGLTVLVGANNAGKSTAIEALRALATNQNISISRGKRNEKAGDQVEITANSLTGETFTLKSNYPGTSETQRSERVPQWAKALAVPSRRAFSPYFGKNELNRETYRDQQGLPAARETASSNFSSRLFEVAKNPREFNKILGRVIEPVPTWTIDLEETGNYFVKIKVGDATHSSEGAGEGFVSLLFIVDALHAMSNPEMVAIDEPELSLYPAVQRRLASLISEYAANNQILIATHSPYFVDIEALGAGGRFVRVFRRDQGTEFAQLSPETALRLHKTSLDMNNPHILGLNAREVFFLEDKVVIVEGQEDVMFYGTALDDIKQELQGTIFGWGAGGADKIELIATVLSELRFKKVVGLVDANKADLLPALRRQFEDYHFDAIPADDVRTKPAAKAREARAGLLDDRNEIVRPEYRDSFSGVIETVNKYFSA